ncbi:MAG TPA: efflux RND transporter periplasmic adaptor subunit [Bryobacteraceae bacterium]|jgi:multidrug efflux pump subunit AcrA (membrane-fusion protein)
MKVRRPRLWLRLGLLLLAVSASALAVRQMRKNHDLTDLPTATARQSDFLVLVRCRGQLVARRSEQVVAPLVPDLQIVWLAPEGSLVKAGQVIIRFDPSKAQQDLKEKNAALEQAQATLDQALAQGNITVEQDKLDLATINYQSERARLEASKQSIVSAIQGQESAIDLGVAEEKVKLQRSGMELHDKATEARIASLTRLRDDAKFWVDFTQRHIKAMEITSPLDGVINYSPNYSQGWLNAQSYKVGDHAVPGGVLAEVPDLSTLEVESKVDEVDRGRIAVDNDVLVHVDAFPEKVLKAKLVSITPLAEQNNEWPPTRSFKGYAKLESPDSRMRPGMNAGADVIQAKIPQAISIPAKALFTIAGKPVVYVKADTKYMPTPVTIAARNPDEIAVQGIAAGTLVALAEPPAEKK